MQIEFQGALDRDVGQVILPNQQLVMVVPHFPKQGSIIFFKKLMVRLQRMGFLVEVIFVFSPLKGGN